MIKKWQHSHSFGTLKNQQIGKAYVLEHVTEVDTMNASQTKIQGYAGQSLTWKQVH